MSFNDIHAGARLHPSKRALMYNGQSITYAEFSNAIATTLGYLETQTFGEGRLVVVIVHNIMDCWVLVMALQYLGKDTICIRSDLGLEARTLSAVSAFVSIEKEALQHQIKAGFWNGSKSIIAPDPRYIGGEPSLSSALKEPTKMGGHILYTSGTTGAYKKLYFAPSLQAKRNAERPDYNPNTVFHAVKFGLWTPVGYKMPLSAWHVGGSVIIDQRADWYRHLADSGLTKMVLVPHMVHELLASLEEGSSSTPKMDFQLSITSGFLTRNMAETLLNRVTSDLKNIYASTELHLGALQSKVSDLDDLHWLEVLQGRLVEVVDEDGNICPADVEGEIRIGLTELDCHEYIGDANASAKVFREGYFHPGDMAVRRADGRVRVLGRSVDVLNFRGQKHAVAPMEEKIQNYLRVSGLCLFSGINKEGENELVVAIESEQWPDAFELDTLGHEFAVFDQVRFAIVHPFPRTVTGTSKINRSALRKLVFPVDQ